MSNIVNKVKDKVDNVLHKDQHHGTNTAHTGHTGAGTHAGTHTGTHTGPHATNTANQVDPRVDSDRDRSTNFGAASHGPGAHHTSTNAGPHDSNVLNKADPRVDSDRDRSTNLGAAGYGPGAHHNTSTNTGPHSSNLLNKADPRVDSDRDRSTNMGAAGYGPGAHHTGGHTGATSGTGLGSGTGYGTGSTNHGPHDSNVLNKADPRVDSDRDNSHNLGAAAYGPGAHQNTSGLGNTGFGSSSTNYGPHDSNVANKLDPRVDSDRDNSRNAGAAAYGPGAHHSGGGLTGNTGTHGTGGGLTGNTGTHGTTAGPHGSDFANKLDPRVDSDRDGSKTFGATR